MHHGGSVLCGVANSDSPIHDHVVETWQGQGVLEITLGYHVEQLSSSGPCPTSCSRVYMGMPWGIKRRQ